MAAVIDEAVAARRYEGVGAVEEERFEPEPAPDVVLRDIEGSASGTEGDEPLPDGFCVGRDPRAPLNRDTMVRFRSLYESRDGRLCLYEDERGHLQAVDASNLA